MRVKMMVERMGSFVKNLLISARIQHIIIA